MIDETPPLIFDDPSLGVRRIMFNRPDKLNAFTAAMYDGLLTELERIRFDPTIRVVILTGAGRGFCGGNDLGGMGQLADVPTDVGKAYSDRYSLMVLARIPAAMRSLPQPIIAAVNGAAAGIGYSLALAADLAIAAQSAKFVNAIHNAGTGTELGLSYMLPRAVGTQRAAELLLTARPVLAEEAERIGLVLKTVPDNELMDVVLELAESIAVNTPIGIWLTKQSLWTNQAAGSLDAAIEFEHRAVMIAQRTDDATEKRAAFVEKRKPNFSSR
jgi:enoyl-CoA hydratase